AISVIRTAREDGCPSEAVAPVCKHTFVKLLSYFKAFLEGTVNLNQARIDQLDARVEAISNALRADSQLGELVVDVIPQGSYAHKTIIRPLPEHEFDADVLLQLEEQTGWEPKDYVENVYKAFRCNGTYK